MMHGIDKTRPFLWRKRKKESDIAFLCVLIFILSLCMQTPCAAEEPLGIEPIHRSDIIYFIFTDRFYNGNSDNDFKTNLNDPKAYHGGDFEGIRQKLDYLLDLGITTIWISPPYDNEPFGYHGYWIYDFYNTEEHFGTMDELKTLIHEAHEKGIKVILDMIVNHTGIRHPWVSDPAYADWFHDTGKIMDFSNQIEVETGRLANLPDLAQENPDVRQYLIDNCLWWIRETGCDGFRFDTVRHVPKDFWVELIQAILNEYPDFYMIGEVFDGNPAYVSSYQRCGFSGMIDFPMYYALQDVFLRSQPTQRLVDVINASKSYPDKHLWGTFIDNHDVKRFVTAAGRDADVKLKQALIFMMTYTGIPIIYYGTEIAMPGGDDPDNRRDMQWNTESEIYPFVKQLIQIRKNNKALTLGELTIKDYDRNHICYVRKHEDNTILVAHNTSARETTLKINVSEPSVQYHSAVNLLNRNHSYPIKKNVLTIKLMPRESIILMFSEERSDFPWLIPIGIIILLTGILLWAVKKGRRLFQRRRRKI